MAVGAFLLIILVVVVLAVVAVSVVSYMGSGAPDTRRKIREANNIALAAKSREKIAVTALRSIANGAGRPDLEAQLALDNIDQTYTKELNS